MNDVKVIVSLTTHDIRLTNGTAEKVIKNILDGTFKDIRVVLTLFKDDIDKIPASLKTLIDKNAIELIVADENLRPHLKYFYAMQKYRDLPVITIDDDILYPDNFVEEVYKNWLLHKDCIIGRRCYRIISVNGQLARYFYWMRPGIVKTLEPTQALFATGVGGILYPPNCLELSEKDIPEIKETLIDDDFYLKAKEIKKGIKIFSIIGDENKLYKQNLDDPVTQSIALGLINCAQGESDNNIAKYYFEFLEASKDKVIDFIVSVTSFGERMNNMLPKILESLYAQTNQNFKVCITLTQEDFDTITNQFLKDRIQTGEYKVIIADQNLKPHLKYFYAMQMYPDMPIVTIDDDTLLPNIAFDELYSTYSRCGKQYVYGRQVFEYRGLGYSILGSRTLYADEPPNHKFMIEGFSGVLYPPRVFGDFYKDENELKKIKELIHDDDIYLKGLEIRRNVLVKNCPWMTGNRHRAIDTNTDLEQYELHKRTNTDEVRTKNFEKIKEEIEKVFK